MARDHAGTLIDIGGALLGPDHIGVDGYRMQLGPGIDVSQDFLRQAGDARLRFGHLIGMRQRPALCLRPTLQEIRKDRPLVADGVVGSGLVGIGIPQADCVDDHFGVIVQFFDGDIGIPGRPGIYRAGRQRRLGVGGIEEDQLHVAGLEASLLQRDDHQEMTDRSARGGDAPAFEAGDVGYR